MNYKNVVVIFKNVLMILHWVIICTISSIVVVAPMVGESASPLSPWGEGPGVRLFFRAPGFLGVKFFLH